MNGCSEYNEEEWMGEMLQEMGDIGGGGGGGGEGEEVVVACMGNTCSKKRMRHINNERQRRILMNTLLDSLQALLPDPHPRKDRCALLTDVIAHVQSLEEEVQDLAARTAQMKKVGKPKVAALSATSSSNTMSEKQQLVSSTNLRNVHVQAIRPPDQSSSSTSAPTLSGNMEEIILTFASSPIRGLLPHVLALFQMSQIEVLNATVSTTPDSQMLYYIHARVPKDYSFQSDELKVLFSHMTFNEADISYSFTL